MWSVWENKQGYSIVLALLFILGIQMQEVWKSLKGSFLQKLIVGGPVVAADIS